MFFLVLEIFMDHLHRVALPAIKVSNLFTGTKIQKKSDICKFFSNYFRAICQVFSGLNNPRLLPNKAGLFANKGRLFFLSRSCHAFSWFHLTVFTGLNWITCQHRLNRTENLVSRCRCFLKGLSSLGNIGQIPSPPFLRGQS